jgi:RNA polymerase sigma-70 factor (TIGR02960 family)
MAVEDEALARARAGDGQAFRELVEPYVRELQVHCYRIVGSVQDAEDLTQETLLAAWRGLDGYEGRASLRVWLYRIATNRCLNALRDRKRRPEEREAMVQPPEPTRFSEPIWLEPYPDVFLDGLEGLALGPDALYEWNESVALALVAALQHLPPRQRAVVVLRDVLGFPNDDVADILGTTELSVKGTLQRARATLRMHLPEPGNEPAPGPRSPGEREIAGRFAAAVENGDVDTILTLLTEDAWLTMPPEPYEYQGRAAIGRFLVDRAEMRGGNFRLVPTRANRQPAFGCYLPDAHADVARAYGLMVLTLSGDHICAITWFSDRSLMATFGLPRTLPS